MFGMSLLHERLVVHSAKKAPSFGEEILIRRETSFFLCLNKVNKETYG